MSRKLGDFDARKVLGIDATRNHDPARCSVCGYTRIPLTRDGSRFGACSLVPGNDGKGGCPDPLRDYNREQEARLAAAADVRARPGLGGSDGELVFPPGMTCAAPSPSPRSGRTLREEIGALCGLGRVVGPAELAWALDNCPDAASPRSPSATPDAAAWEVYEDLRCRYASACERMGMAHANGTRAEWEDAAHYEVERRLALNAAVRSLSRATPDRAEVERAVDALANAAMRWEMQQGDDAAEEAAFDAARAALLSLIFPETKP